MKASQFIAKYVNPEKMSAAFFAELKDALYRQGANGSADLLQALYGNEREDLELEQLRLDLVKTRAEVDEILASAAKDRADAEEGLNSTIYECIHTRLIRPLSIRCCSKARM